MPPDWDRLAGPESIGRSIVVAAGSDAPAPWDNAPRLAVSVSAMDALQVAYSNRVRTVLEVDGPLPEPVSVTPSALSDLRPSLEPANERLLHLVFSNSVDARDPAAPSIPAVDMAIRCGGRLAPGEPAGDIIDRDGVPLWCDGGPLRPFAPNEVDGLGVIPRIHLPAGLLSPITDRAPTVELAPDQLAAVRTRNAGARIVAPAGSGKTRVLTERARHLVADLGVSPSTVCLVAFNVKARQEMQSRTSDLPGLEVRTLNSLALAICRGTGPFLTPSDPRVQVIDERGMRDRIRGLVKAPRRAMTDPFAAWIEAFTACRLGLRDADEVEAEFGGDVPDLAAVIGRYRRMLADNGEVDFDEQIVKAIGILLEEPDCRAVARAACGTLLVDEFQDLTPAHLLLIRLLAGPAAEVFGVGDDDQTIYGYSGASPSWLIDFSRWFPGSTTHDLHVNYRCAPVVISAAVKLLSHNRRRIPKKIVAGPGRTPITEPPENGRTPMSVITGPDPLSSLVSEIGRLINSGAAPDQIAVLTRVNATLLAPMLALRDAGIATSTPVDSTYLSRTGVAASLAWLRLATCPSRRLDDDAIGIAARRPPRGLSPMVVGWAAEQNSTSDLQRLAGRMRTPRDSQKITDLADDIDAIRSEADHGADTARLLTFVKDTIGLGGALDSRLDASRRSVDRSSHGDDLDALISVAHLQADPSLFSSWLRDQLAEPRGTDRHGLTLSTIHRVKGMQWPHVVVHRVDAGLCPHRLSSDIEEERRIFHVAITRSSETTAVITGPNPSSFVPELRTEAPPEPTAGSEPLPSSPSTPGLRNPVARSTKSADADNRLGGDDQAVFEHLRRWRSIRAKGDAVPAYVVFPDRTLVAVARARPTTDADLLAIPGIGPTKLERYGPDIIEMMLEL